MIGQQPFSDRPETRVPTRRPRSPPAGATVLRLNPGRTDRSDMTDTRRQHSRPGASVSRFLLPAIGIGLIAAALIISVGGQYIARPTESHVARLVRDMALAGTDPRAEPGANYFGPWRLAATSVDPMSGVYSNFRVESGAMIVTALTARLLIDTEADTLTFELYDVTYMRVPEDDEEGEAYVHELERWTLGPAPYGEDIVPDGTSSPMPAAPGETHDIASVDDYAVR